MGYRSRDIKGCTPCLFPGNTPVRVRRNEKMMADKTQVSKLLKTAKGQIEGILRMIEEDRYCIDISNQIMSTQAILKKANTVVLTAHCRGCVADARTDEEKAEKVDEMVELLTKLLK